LINELSEAMSKGQGKDVIGKILSGLAAYAAEHFSCEEEYFARFNYVGQLVHKREHKDFVDRVTKFQDDYKAGKVILSLEVMKFLKDWLQSHILVSDKEYVSCFKENGVY